MASDWSRVITWPGNWPLIGRHVVIIVSQDCECASRDWGRPFTIFTRLIPPWSEIRVMTRTRVNIAHVATCHSNQRNYTSLIATISLWQSVNLYANVSAMYAMICILSTWLLASDWSIVITWPGYWLLIGREWSYDKDSGLWLVEVCHIMHRECELFTHFAQCRFMLVVLPLIHCAPL